MIHRNELINNHKNNITKLCFCPVWLESNPSEMSFFMFCVVGILCGLTLLFPERRGNVTVEGYLTQSQLSKVTPHAGAN